MGDTALATCPICGVTLSDADTTPCRDIKDCPASVGLPYGIIDPDYARIFTIARLVSWSYGYALMMHGSFTRDLDLLAVPWTEGAVEPEKIVRQIEDRADLRRIKPEPSNHPHGRLVWTLMLPGFKDNRFVDLGVFPRAAPPNPSP